MAAVPFLPSLVAVIVAAPALAAVTRPPEPTVAMEELLVAHVTVRPLSAFPAESFVVAESRMVWPT
jgi:hypothetical protein